MALVKINSRPTQRQLRQFAVLWLPFFSLIAAWIGWRHGASDRALLGALSFVVAFAGLGLLKPSAVRPVFVALTVAAYPIGWVVGHLLLAILFFGVVTPIGLIMRLFRIDPMQRIWDRTAVSYWQSRRSAEDLENYFRQY
jgi:polyferredoxin